MSINFRLFTTFTVLWFATFSITCWAQDDEIRRHLLHALGGPFIVYRNNLQTELQLSTRQKQELQDSLADYLQKPLKVFRRFKDLDSGPGEKEMRNIRQVSYEKFWEQLGAILTPVQLTRLQQLELQHEGPSALLRPEIVRKLQLSDIQRNQLVQIVRAMQRKLEPLMQEAHAGGNLQKIRLMAVRLYGEQEQKVEFVLDETQKRQWSEMYGKPFDVFNDEG